MRDDDKTYTVYDYHCFDCELVFGMEHPFAEAPDQDACPQCGKPCNRNYSNQSIAFVGNDWHTNTSRARKAQKSKTDNKRGWEALVHQTKNSLNSAETKQFYKQPGINWNYLEEKGQARKMTSEEHEASNKLAVDTSNHIKNEGKNFKVKDD